MYVKIDDAETYTKRHLKFCKALGVMGRILVADEGINGTISGTPDQCDAYIQALHMDPRFTDMEFKIDESDEQPFKKLFVRYRKEIVTLNLEEDIDPNEITGKHLSPKEFMETMEKEDVLIIDARNDYEYEIGHFKNAIRPDIAAFREFPEWVRENLEKYKDKKILAYCTGGIRCEKFTGLLLKEGFNDVSQLHGGIIKYSQHPDTKGKYFEGKCYVFDERIAVPVNFAEGDIIVSKCKHCGEPCDRYINCAHMDCNLQFFCCEKCDEEYHHSCSEGCMHAEHRRDSIES
jgi:UPF0176 protein